MHAQCTASLSDDKESTRLNSAAYRKPYHEGLTCSSFDQSISLSLVNINSSRQTFSPVLMHKQLHEMMQRESSCQDYEGFPEPSP